MGLINYRNFFKEEEEFLADIEIDYVPLHDIVRIFSGYNKLIPTDKEYFQALEFLKYLLSKYKNKLKYYLGPGVTCIQKSPEEFLAWLKEIWYTGKYKEMNYGVWFDLD